jgi:hypothetical protein
LFFLCFSSWHFKFTYHLHLILRFELPHLSHHTSWLHDVFP